MAGFYVMRSAWEAAPREAPSGTTLLAVGDVHGCAAHLDAMLGVLAGVVRGAQAAGRACELVMLGDYIDRGPDSPGVLERLPGLGERLGGGVTVHLLRGNHDQFLIEHLRVMPHPGLLDLWLDNGDRALAQLGLDTDAPDWEPIGLSELSARLRQRLGPELVALLSRLRVHVPVGPYLFVHAGVLPDKPLAEHRLEELLWVREPFLDATAWEHPFTVVHGHTPIGPDVLPHRIGVDGGCFFSGVLTAVEIEGSRLRFHAVSSEADPEEFYQLIEGGPPRAFSTPEPIGQSDLRSGWRHANPGQAGG